MKKKWLGLTVSLLSLIVFLFACNSNNETIKETGNANEGAQEENDEDGITLRVMDWSDSTRYLREEFHEQFMEKYPEVTNIEYTTLTQQQFTDTILNAIRSGDAPDIFPVPLGFSLPVLVDDGWFQPLEPIVEDGFFDIFREGTFQEGINMVDETIYSIPQQTAQPTAMVFYNKELFEKAGLDPEQPPKTYEEFREYARKITEAGNGEFYGLIEGGKQSNRFKFAIQEWGSLNGAGLADNSPVSKLTGEAPYHTEAVTDIFDLFAGLADDGSIHPRTSSLTAPEARQIFANGEAGFIIQGAWNIGVWNANNPELDYGMMTPPVSDDGRQGSIDSVAQGGFGVYAETDHPDLAAKYLEELYGGDFYQHKVVENQHNYSPVAGVIEEAATGEFLEFYELFNEILVHGPVPESENPDVTKALGEYVDVTPSAAEIMQGVAISGLRDYEPMLQDLSEQTDAALEKAITEAQDKGADVGMEDFIFPDWDPMKNYKK
ncbi:extracellular solute-binding protein [Gracilibacillus sp. YIM 98692]|uniref:ABC transporter substrate-binding protein n=1 Tax=Gracilibacillus sp. YIM 98692 TaxID=2663532 RepID=UPI0013D57750|nr:extracellular solute-binding protein [Gracilibacillus sp. YIM 98692]